MSTVVDQMHAYLERGDIKFEHDSESGMFRLAFEGKHGDIRVLIVAEENLIQVFSHPANKIPSDHRVSIAQAVARANYNLKLGKFELDLDDGEIRFQTALPIGDAFPEDGVLDHVFYVGGAMIDRYLPAFLAIVYGNEDIKLAIEAAEL